MSNSYINEETEYSKKNRYPVFIVLTYGDNPMGIAISKVTGDEWTHSLISFNPELDPMYTFATRTQKISGLHSLFGYTYQGPKDRWYQNKETKYCVYVMYVNKYAYEKMKERLDYFATHEKESKYDFVGIANIAFNHDSEHHRKYFCSRFVAEILNQGVPLEKLPSLYSPQDLSNLDNITKVNSGKNLFNYDPKVTIKNLKNIRHKIYNKMIFQEGEDEFMVSEMEYMIFEKYLDGKLANEKYVELSEAVNDSIKSKVKLFGCPVTFKASKIDKKIDRSFKSDNQLSTITSAVGLYNSSNKLKNKVDSEVKSEVAQMFSTDEKQVNIHWSSLFNVKRVEANVLDGGNLVYFKCYAEPNLNFKKNLIKYNKQTSEESINTKIRFLKIELKVPNEASQITDKFIADAVSVVWEGKWKDKK